MYNVVKALCNKPCYVAHTSFMKTPMSDTQTRISNTDTSCTLPKHGLHYNYIFKFRTPIMPSLTNIIRFSLTHYIFEILIYLYVYIEDYSGKTPSKSLFI